MPRHQEKRSGNNRRRIPVEILEEILLNLPAKSLLRFSSVSESWNSIIFEPGFIKRYRVRAALPGRERLVISPYPCNYLEDIFSCPLSSLSSDQPIENTTQLVCPIEGYQYLLACCDELWCVRVESSMVLWNPSMTTFKKLPDPSSGKASYFFHFAYGLGYDSVGDDYKILKLQKSDRPRIEGELYSLKSNSWRKIQPVPGKYSLLCNEGVFVCGALHWMVRPNNFPLFYRFPHDSTRVIISFDLSTEKYGEVAQPEYFPTPSRMDRVRVELTVLRGMLCVCLNYYRINTFVLWVMEDYGVAKSWTKKFDINYDNSIPYFRRMYRTNSLITFRPLYFYDNGEILIRVLMDNNYSGIFMYKDEKIMPRKIVGRGFWSRVSDGLLYVESLISPAILPLTPTQVGARSISDS